MSYGEEIMYNHLKARGIEFHHDRNGFFPDRPRLRPDFFIPSLNLVIECDGGHHFDPKSEYFSARVRAGDLYRDAYCFNHRIHVARIPHVNHATKDHTAWIDRALAIAKENVLFLTVIGSDYYENPKALKRIPWPCEADEVDETWQEDELRVEMGQEELGDEEGTSDDESSDAAE